MSLHIFSSGSIINAIEEILSDSRDMVVWLLPGGELNDPSETECKLNALGNPVVISGLPPAGVAGNRHQVLTVLHTVRGHAGGDWQLAWDHKLLPEVQLDCKAYIFKEPKCQS